MRPFFNTNQHSLNGLVNCLQDLFSNRKDESKTLIIENEQLFCVYSRNTLQLSNVRKSDGIFIIRMAYAW